MNELSLKYSDRVFNCYDVDGIPVIYDYSVDDIYRLMISDFDKFKVRNRPSSDFSDVALKLKTKMIILGVEFVSINGYHYRLERYNKSYVFYNRLKHISSLNPSDLTLALYKIDNLDSKNFVYIEPFVELIDLDKRRNERSRIKIISCGFNNLVKTEWCQCISSVSIYDVWCNVGGQKWLMRK